MKKNYDFDIGCLSCVRKSFLACCLFLGLSVIPMCGGAQNRDVRMTLKMQNVSLQEVFKAITAKTGYDFVYSNNLLAKTGKVTVDVKEELLENVLNQVLGASGWGYKIEDNHIIVSPALKKDTPRTMVPVTGTVKSDTGEPLPGVTVVLKGTTVGCASDVNGKFTMVVPKGEENILEFTFVGMKKKEVEVIDTKPLEVVMEVQTNSMDEVVVNGLFSQRKNSYTGSVTSVKGEELLMVSPTNVLKALAFMVPGMHLVENNEQGSNPNAIPEIILRGTTSLAVNGEYGLNTPLIMLDGVEITLQDLYDIDMQDIENVDVLKDASAKAIYGDKAANGVIVVTRKRVTDSKLKVRYNFVPDVSFPDVSSFNLCNGAEKLELERLYGVYDSPTGEFDELYWKRKNIVERGALTDWKAIPLRNSWSFDHSLSLTGRGGGMSYMVNLRYGDTRGVMKGDYRQRYGLGLSLSYNFKDRLNVSYRLDVSKVDSKDSPYGSFSYFAKCNPYDMPKDEYGDWIKAFGDNSTDRNPLYEASLESFGKAASKSITNNLSLRWDIVKGLYLNGGFNYTMSDSRSDNFISPESVDFIAVQSMDERGRYSVAQSETNNWNANSTLSYNWLVDDKGSLLSVNIGGTLSHNKSTNYSFDGVGFLKPSLKSINFAVGYPEGGTPKGNETLSSSVGVFGNLNFIFRDRYFVDCSYRSSGNSSVAKDNRWSPYWSAGIGWNVHKEAFFADSFLQLLRLKGSFGYTGSSNLSNWETRTVYRYNMTSMFVTGIGANPISMANENLKASRTMDLNLGVQLSMLDDRIQLDFNVYKKTTKDMLLPVSYPLSVGVSTLNNNLGEQENRGYDWSFSGVLLKSKDLQWRVTLNGQHNRDKITKISNALKRQNEKNRDQQTATDKIGGTVPTGPKVQFEEGESSSAIYVVRSRGIDPATGYEIFEKKDGTLTFQYDPADKVALGNTIPKLELSLSTSFRWKGFSLFAGMNITRGGWVYNNTRASKVESINIKWNVDRRAFTERWKNPGDRVHYVGFDKTTTLPQTERFLEKRNEFYLSSLGLAYDFNPEWVHRIYLKGLRIGVNFSDVLRLTTVKFERGTSYPYMRGFNFTISPTF